MMSVDHIEVIISSSRNGMGYKWIFAWRENDGYLVTRTTDDKFSGRGKMTEKEAIKLACTTFPDSINFVFDFNLSIKYFDKANNLLATKSVLKLSREQLVISIAHAETRRIFNEIVATLIQLLANGNNLKLPHTPIIN